MALWVFNMDTVGILQAFAGHVHTIKRPKLRYEVIIYIFTKHLDDF